MSGHLEAAPQSAGARAVGGRPTLGAVLALLIFGIGVAIGMRPLSDNSFLTHLATGRLILESGSVPSRDPYTFTAAGEPWVVQSWLASVLYASAERLGGLDGVRLLTGAIIGALAAGAWHLLRSTDAVVARFALLAPVVVVGAELWSERPFLLGLLAFVGYASAAEGRLDPRWLVPVSWLWVNSHGSFPLGLIYLLLVLVGSRLDGMGGEQELRTLGWALLGVLTGVIGPLGVHALLFPIELLGQQSTLQQVVEWQAPTFTTFAERAFLIQLGGAILLLVRRPSYRSGVVLVVFAAAALLGARNVAVASIALLPGMALALHDHDGLSSSNRPRRAGILCALAVILPAMLVLARSSEAPLDLRKYPLTALAFTEWAELDTQQVRVAAPDYVGNLTTLIYGDEGRVFYDDRFDMFPAEVSTIAFALNSAAPGALDELHEVGVDVVLLPRDGAMSQVVTADPDWRQIFSDSGWALSCRRGTELGGRLGEC